MEGKVIQVNDAVDYLQELLENAGLCKEYAQTVTDNLIQAELNGHSSHGLSRCSFYLDKLDGGGFNPNPQIRIIRERTSSLVVDGDGGPGAVVGKFVMERCIEKARTTGVCVGVANRSNHFGIASFYTQMALDRDMIGLATSNAIPFVCPYGGIEPLLGTNPLSFGFPTGGEIPFLFDGATSVVSQGKVMVASKENKKIPEHWGMDRNGVPTTDPKLVLDGMMRAFGEYKGSAVAMLVELLSVTLSAASFSMDVRSLRGQPEEMQGVGFCFIVIDVDAFRDIDEFKAQMDEFIRRVKSSRVEQGFGEILMPGELEYRNAQRARREGFFVGGGVMQELLMLAERYEVKNRRLFA